MRRPIHFEFQVVDPAQSVVFFETVFGWKFKRWEGPQDYWLVTTGDGDAPGIDGGLMAAPDRNARTVNTVEVPSVDEALERIVANGGACVVPKMAIPGIGHLAYCTDPGGLIFGIMHHDPEAR